MISKIKPSHSDEVDVLGIIITIFNNKLKIFLISALAVVLSLGYQIIKKHVPEIMVTTEIRPISTFDKLEYQTYNFAFDKFSPSKETKIIINNFEKKTEELKVISFKSIDGDFLIDLFIEKLNETILLKEGIKKFNLIKKEDYKNQQVYDDAVTKLASEIKFLPPNDDTEKGEVIPYWRIQFITENTATWQKFLEYVEKPANNEIQSHLSKVFFKFIQNEKEFKKFSIEDLNLQMNSAIENYEITIQRKLTYLNEQAKIARTLNVAKNNILESQSFKTDTAVITTLISEIPYYMRGYEMIEKEIELIKDRKNSKAWVKDLDLLESSMRNLTSNKDLERLENLFKKTPIYNSNNFYAGKIMFQSTKDIKLNDRNLIKVLVLSGLLGAIIAIFYLLISNAIQNRR